MSKAQIFYYALSDDMRRKDKLNWFRQNKLENIPFTHLQPDEKHNWVNLTDNDFETLLPVADKEVKLGRKEGAIFDLYSQGIKTNRNEWVYDFNLKTLGEKVQMFSKVFEKEKQRWAESDKKMKTNDFVDRTIKWTAELEDHMVKASKLTINEQCFRFVLYRPFVKIHSYIAEIITHRLYYNRKIFGIEKQLENKAIFFSGIGFSKSFQCFATRTIADYDLLEKPQCLPLYRYDATGTRHDNITDWGLQQFRSHYTTEAIEPASPVCYDSVNDVMVEYRTRQIEKEDIFHYTYAVLHDPAYRTKYELNLKREFPRLPFYKDFWQWAAWGKQLMELHIGYEKAAPYPLERKDVPLAVARARTESSKQAMMQLSQVAKLLFGEPSKTDKLGQPKCKLKAHKEMGTIEIDEETSLSGIPPAAWDYKLGNRSALEWVLDQYKEKKPSDPTIAKQFNTYRFADYKEEVIVLLQRVCTVSLGTAGIVDAMKKG
ncbi:MAG: DNA methyltransferase [Bacteroidetes bacterium]|nr:DNA methyltransferase [Bacteroidota bacterium]